MSVTFTLIPIAIAVGMSLGSSSIVSLLSLSGRGKRDLEPVETRFQNSDMLLKTLGEHGLNVKQVSENEFIVETESGTLRYFRTSEDTPFFLEVKGVKDMQGLMSSLDALENEYGRNVQAFTYDRVMCSLAEHGMGVEAEEVLEDDSILLTLRL